MTCDKVPNRTGSREESHKNKRGQIIYVSKTQVVKNDKMGESAGNSYLRTSSHIKLWIMESPCLLQNSPLLDPKEW